MMLLLLSIGLNYILQFFLNSAIFSLNKNKNSFFLFYFLMNFMALINSDFLCISISKYNVKNHWNMRVSSNTFQFKTFTQQGNQEYKSIINQNSLRGLWLTFDLILLCRNHLHHYTSIIYALCRYYLILNKRNVKNRKLCLKM